MAESSKSGNLHESYATETVAPPSERATGLTFAAVALVVAAVQYHRPLVLTLALAAAAGLTALALGAPGLLKPLNIAWFRFGMLLHRVVNPVVMGLMFVLAIVIPGLIMRLFRDPLRLKADRSAATYWHAVTPPAAGERSMRNQF